MKPKSLVLQHLMPRLDQDVVVVLFYVTTCYYICYCRVQPWYLKLPSICNAKNVFPFTCRTATLHVHPVQEASDRIFLPPQECYPPPYRRSLIVYFVPTGVLPSTVQEVSDRIFRLRLLAKFLGLVTFRGLHSDGEIPEQVLTSSIQMRNRVSPPAGCGPLLSWEAGLMHRPLKYLLNKV